MEAHKAMVLGYKVNIEASLADILDLKLKLGARYISPKESTLDVYKKLVIERKSDRKFDFFDYYLAATMISNDVKTIYTANAKDFGEIKGIRAINPL
jgi:predicted nucleic acid-binding protein